MSDPLKKELEENGYSLVREFMFPEWRGKHYEVWGCLVGTDYGPELSVIIRKNHGEIVWGSQEAMSVDGQINLWKQDMLEENHAS